MFKPILAVIGVAIVAVLGYAATKPDTFTVKRSSTIAAPPEKVFARINDVRAFNQWNPFSLKDPAIKLRYEGPASGPGAAYRWESETVGAGRMRVIEAAEPSRVAMVLAFEKPFEATNRVDFTLTPIGGTTQVTWSMQGSMPYTHKVMTVFVDMEKMIGDDFEAGLANLKASAERG